MATPAMSPAGSPFPSYSTQPTDPILCIEKERMDVLVKQFQGRIGVLYSERTVFYKQLANSIVGHYRTSLHYTDAETINYDSSKWVDHVGSFSHLIFVGLPSVKKKTRVTVRGLGKTQPSEKSSKEEEAVSRNRHKLSTVVVLDPEVPRTRMHYRQQPPHFLDRFLHIHMLNDPVWLAQAAFAIFATPTPVASPDDSAFWSATPKLVEGWKDSNSLGITIMTREMAHESPFSRIVLIKDFNDDCCSDIKGKVGKYTHIQFFNGIFLDGLSIDKVREIFDVARHSRIQLLVRYIHPIRPPQLQYLPSRASTYQPSRARQPRRLSADGSEALPFPIYILGDNVTLQKELFQLLLTDDSGVGVLPSPTTPATTPAMTPATTVIQSASPINASRSLASPPLSLPASNVCTPIGGDNNGHLLSLGSSQAMKVRLRKRSSSLPSGFSESDEFVQRAEVPSGRFKIDSNFLPDFDRASGDVPKVHTPPIIRRSVSTHPEISSPQFILNMLRRSVDRNLSHLFLKPNGIYLIVIGLEDIVADPLIQYDNLFFWLRLIHTHVKPAEIKRIIVVGMYRKSDIQEESKIIQCVQHLNTAIREQMKQNYSLPIKEGGNVFIYDLDAPNDLLYLCACIQMCVEVFIDQAWYFQKDFFERVFQPFESYRIVCAEVLRQSKMKVVVRRQRIEQLYQAKSRLPENFWDTVQLYSSAMCKDKNSDCFLQPSFIVKLLNKCTQVNQDVRHHDGQVFPVRHPALNDLPIIRAQLLNHHMAREMHIMEQSHQNTVIEWMKQLEVVYSLGKFGADKDTFFIPYLASHSLSDALFNWKDAVAEEFDKGSVVLYARLMFPSTHKFFYQLIASLLTDVLQNLSTSPHSFINQGCMEAIFPLNSKDQPQSMVAYPTLFRYHSIQNVIEFRTITNRPLSFLHAVEAKLQEVYVQRCYNNDLETFNGAVSFHIPSTEFSDAIRESAVWRLGNVGRRGGQSHKGLLEMDGENGLSDEDEGIVKHDGEDEEEEEHFYEGPEKLLLKMKFLTDPGGRNSTELKAWASNAPEMKVLPSELFLNVSKVLSSSEQYWPMVAAKLDLMEQLEIQCLRNTPAKGGNGTEVLHKWQESSLTYRDLVTVLREVKLNQVAQRIEDFYERQDSS